MCQPALPQLSLSGPACSPREPKLEELRGPGPHWAPGPGFPEQTHLHAGKPLSGLGSTHCTQSWAQDHGTGN